VDALASVFFLNARRAYEVSQEGIYAMQQKTAKLGKSWAKLTTLAKHVAELKKVQGRISKAQQKYVQAKGNVIRAIGDGTAKMVGLDAMIKTDQKYVDGTLLPKIRMLRASELKLLQDEQKFYQEEQKIVLERQKRKLAHSVGMSLQQFEAQQNNTFTVTPPTPQQQLVQPETTLIKDFKTLQLMDTTE
jgi:hypothetical protein